MDDRKSLTELLMEIRPGEKIILRFKSRCSLKATKNKIAAFNSLINLHKKLYCQRLTPRRSNIHLLIVSCTAAHREHDDFGTIIFR